ncbi:MAG: preprotein translocase subunit YajC [Verrucomicrobia bacterium]|nr:preprotein translocase subunit YajC [Verrucomicrobiota bacterium]
MDDYFHMMSLNRILFLADAPSAAAAAAASPGAPSAPSGPVSPLQTFFGSPVIFFALLIVMMYFLLFRPQSQQRKQQARLLEGLKAGDRIVTSSGIVGVVITVKDKTVSLRSMDAKMEVTKSSVTEILERAGQEKSGT